MIQKFQLVKKNNNYYNINNWKGTIITFRQPTEEEKPNLPPGVEGILWRIRPGIFQFQ